MTVKIRIDGTKCRGLGLCVIAAPDLFEVVGLGMARVTTAGVPEGELHAKAAKAAGYCCADAIRIDESE